MACTVTSIPFGESDGTAVSEYTLTNASGMELKVLTWGATLRCLTVADRDGAFADVLLGFDTLAEYTTEPGSPFFSATVGRTAGRIKAPGFSTKDGAFALDATDAPFINPTGSLHGGKVGFDKVVWSVSAVSASAGDSGAASLTLRHVSADGDQGFPGELTTDVTYTLTNANELVLEYAASSTKDTPCSLTDHSYWNLGGHAAGASTAGGAAGVRDHELQLECEQVMLVVVLLVLLLLAVQLLVLTLLVLTPSLPVAADGHGGRGWAQRQQDLHAGRGVLPEQGRQRHLERRDPHGGVPRRGRQVTDFFPRVIPAL